MKMIILIAFLTLIFLLLGLFFYNKSSSSNKSFFDSRIVPNKVESTIGNDSSFNLLIKELHDEYEKRLYLFEVSSKNNDGLIIKINNNDSYQVSLNSGESISIPIKVSGNKLGNYNFKIVVHSSDYNKNVELNGKLKVTN